MLDAKNSTEDAEARAVYHQLLADEHRRIVIEELGERRSISIDELVEEVTASYRGFDDPQMVRTALYHHHLPALADGDVITMESAADEITINRPAIDDLLRLDRAAAEIVGSDT